MLFAIWLLYDYYQAIIERQDVNKTLRFFIHAQHLEYTFKDSTPIPSCSAPFLTQVVPSSSQFEPKSPETVERERILEEYASYCYTLIFNYGPIRDALQGVFKAIELLTPDELMCITRLYFLALAPNSQIKLIKRVTDLRREISRLVKESQSQGNELQCALDFAVMFKSWMTQFSDLAQQGKWELSVEKSDEPGMVRVTPEVYMLYEWYQEIERRMKGEVSRGVISEDDETAAIVQRKDEG
jgi:hypothetical protein